MLKPATGTLPPGVFEHFVQVFSSQLVLALFLGVGPRACSSLAGRGTTGWACRRCPDSSSAASRTGW